MRVFNSATAIVARRPWAAALAAAALLVSAPTLAQTEAEGGDKIVDDLSRAAEQLGLQMLRPRAEVEINRPYSMIVRNPRELIPLGVDNVGPGDRVICRLMEGNRIVLSTSYGDRSAPIQLAADGSIKSTSEVPEIEGNKHYSAQQRDRRQPPDQRSGAGARSGAGGAGGTGIQPGMSGGMSGGGMR